MNWTRAQDLKAQVLRLWDRGDLLRDAVRGSERFPLRLVLKGPSSADLTERFDAVRVWAEALATSAPLRVEWQTVQHRVQGRQQVPASVWIDTCHDALAWIGKRREAQRFATLVDTTRSACPALLPWLERRPLQALALADAWNPLLAVVQALQSRPRPGVYLRQFEVPGVHSKFIEAHRSVLSELLDLALPPEAIDSRSAGVAQFTARYGFRDKPVRIRVRVLDARIATLPGLTEPDLTLDGTSFTQLALTGVERVLITENETNFLALPPLAGCLGLFGAGYGWDALARAHWLQRCALHYWGDLDTHGFAILDQLRQHFAHTRSVLMDHATLLAHRPFWGQEDKPTHADLPRLSADEAALYNDLRDHRFAERLRLEQEHLGFGWVQEHLQALG